MAMTSQNRAAEYHARAREAAVLAAASTLLRVRELHELAASRWTQLADLEDRRTLSLARRFGRALAAAAPAAALDDEEAACAG